jgi:cell wall-associated NlpC family hydrolase
VTDGRKLIPRALATLGIAAISSSMFVAAPSHATPDIDSVQSRVDRLYKQAEQASERYNDARLELKKSTTRLKALHSDLHRQRSKVASIRQEVAASVVAQYQGQALSSTSQLMLSDDPDTFINQLTTVSEYNDQRSQMMSDFAVQAKRLEMRQASAKRELTRVAATKKKLGTEKARIDEKAAEAKDLLGKLQDRAAARASRSQERTAPAAPSAPPASAPASGRAAAAVQYAMAQVGKAYVYGAAGPSAFDCSGLTMMAWQQAGVSLPHSSGAQMSSGTPVQQSELQPGDLVFYYSPVSHVGMYIGNGQIVNALNPGAGIKVSGVNDMPYAGAVRPG